jgi:hypothetical protein
MALPTSYSWPIPVPTGSSPPPPFNPGPPVNAIPSFNDPRKKQFGSGIRFANVPGGKSTNVQQLAGQGQVFHVSTVIGAKMSHVDFFADQSGVVQSRKRGNFKPVPSAIRHFDIKEADRFGNPILPGTGQYPPGFQFITYDDGFWNNTPLQQVNYPASRYMALQMVGTNSIFKAGGLDAGGSPMTGTEIYSTGSSMWITASDMPGAKSYGAAALLPNGDILVLGGSGSSAADSTASFHYIVTSSLWATTPFLSSALVPRVEFAMVSLNDGRVFAPGGCGLISGTSQFTGSELFIPSGTGGVYANPRVEFWTGSISIPLYPFNRQGYSLTKLNDGTVLLLGGHDPLTLQPTSHALRYVPSNIFLPGSNGTWVIEPSMSFARSGHRAVLLDDGKVLVAGGNGGPGSNLAGRLPWQVAGQYGARAAIPDAEVFNPGPGVGPDVGWSGSISTVLGSFTGSDGGHYTTGSFSYIGPLIYGSGSWSSGGQMRKARTHFSMIALKNDSAEGRIMVAGGFNDETYLSSSELFDYEHRVWHEVTPMQQPTARMRIFNLNLNLAQSPYVLMVVSGETTGSRPNAFAGSQVFQTNG